MHKIDTCIVGKPWSETCFTPGVSEFPSFQSILPSTNPWDVLMLGFRACFRPSFGIRPKKNTSLDGMLSYALEVLGVVYKSRSLYQHTRNLVANLIVEYVDIIFTSNRTGNYLNNPQFQDC